MRALNSTNKVLVSCLVLKTTTKLNHEPPVKEVLYRPLMFTATSRTIVDRHSGQQWLDTRHDPKRSCLLYSGFILPIEF